MMKHAYSGKSEIFDDHRPGKNIVKLKGRLNKRGAISLRFDVQLKDLEKWQNSLLPFHQLGSIVVKTSAVSWTRKNPYENTQEEKSWDSFSRDVKLAYK
jgi:ribosomal protein S8